VYSIYACPAPYSPIQLPASPRSAPSPKPRSERGRLMRPGRCSMAASGSTRLPVQLVRLHGGDQGLSGRAPMCYPHTAAGSPRSVGQPGASACRRPMFLRAVVIEGECGKLHHGARTPEVLGAPPSLWRGFFQLSRTPLSSASQPGCPPVLASRRGGPQSRNSPRPVVALGRGTAGGFCLSAADLLLFSASGLPSHPADDLSAGRSPRSV
jgi:hypothetical protein